MSIITAGKQMLSGLAAERAQAPGSVVSGLTITIFRFSCYLTGYQSPEVVITPAYEDLSAVNNRH